MFSTPPLLVNDSIALHPLAGPDATHWGTVLAAMEPWKRLGSSPGGLARYLCRPDGALFRLAIRVGETGAGVVCVRYPWLRGPFLEVLAITPPFQGQGVGTAVVGWLCGRGAALGEDNLWVTVSDFNGAARGFYGRLGFVAVASLPGLLRAGRQEILLRRHPLRGPSGHNPGQGQQDEGGIGAL